jgi:hypothetical protein
MSNVRWGFSNSQAYNAPVSGARRKRSAGVMASETTSGVGDGVGVFAPQAARTIHIHKVARPEPPFFIDLAVTLFFMSIMFFGVDSPF